MRIILLGNAGAGKSTLARRLIGSRNVPRLSLDEIAWYEGPERKPLEASLEELYRSLEANDQQCGRLPLDGLMINVMINEMRVFAGG